MKIAETLSSIIHLIATWCHTPLRLIKARTQSCKKWLCANWQENVWSVLYFLLAFSCWYKAFIYSGSQQNRWNEQPTLAANMQDCVVFFRDCGYLQFGCFWWSFCERHMVCKEKINKQAVWSRAWPSAATASGHSLRNLRKASWISIENGTILLVLSLRCSLQGQFAYRQDVVKHFLWKCSYQPFKTQTCVLWFLSLPRAHWRCYQNEPSSSILVPLRLFH